MTQGRKKLGLIPQTDPLPPCPKELKGEARKYFFQTCQQLQSLGLLSLTDTDKISLYADSWAKYWACMKQAEEEGLVYEERGYKRSSPYLKIAQQLSNLCSKLQNELGLSPAGRSRMDKQEEEVVEKDPLEVLIAEAKAKSKKAKTA